MTDFSEIIHSVFKKGIQIVLLCINCYLFVFVKHYGIFIEIHENTMYNIKNCFRQPCAAQSSLKDMNWDQEQWKPLICKFDYYKFIIMIIGCNYNYERQFNTQLVINVYKWSGSWFM